jgi:hypothetical protein
MAPNDAAEARQRSIPERDMARIVLDEHFRIDADS